MDALTVAVRAPILGADLAYVVDVDPRVRVIDLNRAGEDEVAAALVRAEVFLVGYPVPKVVAGRAPRLRWAHHTQAGVSNLRGSDLWTADITLTSSRGFVSTTGIAEFVMAGAYYFARGLNEAGRQDRAGEFSRGGYTKMTTLTGATMGVVGLGGIGQEVARLARAAGLRVIGTRRSIAAPVTDTDGADLVLPADQIEEIAALSDYLVVCSQLTDETRGMINARVFAAMKPSGILINIARGEEVDEDALLAALATGGLAGAVLDVYVGDPGPPRPELIDHPRILLTPHISGSNEVSDYGPGREIFADNLRRFIDGRELRNVVDRRRGY